MLNKKSFLTMSVLLIGGAVLLPVQAATNDLPLEFQALRALGKTRESLQTMRVGEEQDLFMGRRLYYVNRQSETSYSVGGRGFSIETGPDGRGNIVTLTTPLRLFAQDGPQLDLPGGLLEFVRDPKAVLRGVGAKMISRWEVLKEAPRAGGTTEMPAPERRLERESSSRAGGTTRMLAVERGPERDSSLRTSVSRSSINLGEMKVGADLPIRNECRIFRESLDTYLFFGNGIAINVGGRHKLAVDAPIVVYNKAGKRVVVPGGVKEIVQNPAGIFSQLDDQTISRWEAEGASALEGRVASMRVAAQK